MKLAEVSNGRDNNLNLIRVLAALAVLVSHSFVLATGNALLEPLRSTTGLSLAEIAVDVFFVISGFLICRSAVERSVASYLVARVLRIYPALLVMLVTTAIACWQMFSHAPASVYFTHPETRNFIVKNATLIGGIGFYLPDAFRSNPLPGIVNGSLWTLTTEIRLYIGALLVAIVLSALQRSTRAGKAISLTLWVLSALFLAFIVLIKVPITANVRLCMMFAAGAALYFWRESVKLTGIAAAVMGALLVLSAYTSAFLFVYAVALPYLVMWLAYAPAGRVRSYNRVGDYSYGVYIYAFPVQQSVVALIPGASPWTVMAYATPVVLALAMLSWHLIESPALKLRFRSGGQSRMSRTNGTSESSTS